MQLSPYDCLGCGVCLTACPAKDALTWAPFEEMKSEQPLFDDVAMNESYLKKDVISDKSVKNVQFAKPYFQFYAACAGCAETTYIKLLSQLFGDRMYVGNAAGCSSAISECRKNAVMVEVPGQSLAKSLPECRVTPAEIRPRRSG